MRFPWIQWLLLAGLLAGCGGGAPIKPAEMFDERTGATVAGLEQPLEFVEDPHGTVLTDDKRSSFSYIGPVEWDRSGDISYGIWVHVAPGNDKQVDDLRLKGAVTLTLDDGPLVLERTETAGLGNGPYRAVASWGQTVYFQADAATLERLAHSDKLIMTLRGVGQSADDPGVDFLPTRETRATLQKFVESRGITGG